MRGAKKTEPLRGSLGIREKGVQTRQKIIDEARRTLIDEGYESFVLRRIAQNVGIKPGNLQYYFNNKQELLWAVLEPEMARYEGVYEDLVEENHDLDSFIDALFIFLMEDIQLKSTCNIWYVVWSVSQHDQDIGGLMDQWYRDYIQALSKLFKRIDPNIDDATAGNLASIVTALVDGLMVQIGHGKKPKKVHRNIKESCVNMLRMFAASGTK